ncbi:MAG: hypothetical protein KJO18_09965, partial [Acidimicrobiia bacterium]|nr:hypothetical protein [Acidimicrobiia bacterium]
MKSTKSPSWINSLFGLVPLPVPPFVFSTAERTVSYLSLAEEGEFQCRESWRVALGEECFQSGPLGGRLQDAESFTRSLDELLDRLIQRPSQASLVVPDNWMRLTFIEVEEWPRRHDEQLEVLRFKLDRIVPFRAAELRIGARRVPALSGESDNRFLVGFGIESAFQQIEEAFADRGIRIGHISNDSLSLLEALKGGLAPAPLGAFVSVSEDRYSVVVTRRGEPIVYRSKAHGSTESLAPVERELRLTRSFLQERVEPGILSDLILAVPEEREASW